MIYEAVVIYEALVPGQGPVPSACGLTEIISATSVVKKRTLAAGCLHPSCLQAQPISALGNEESGPAYTYLQPQRFYQP